MLLALAATLLMRGYADDAVCGDCHADRAKAYMEVGMSRAFVRPRAPALIEDFSAPPYFHAKSKQYFEVRRKGDALVFRRWQLDAAGTPINLFEQKIDWILGSGNHARTYLYQTPNGELYQLPLSWYSQTREWRMAPGYDRADHEGVTRRVRHECMFCHNAYPGVAGEPLSYWRSQSFPSQLPEGIGCQRCHGPGAKHAKTKSRADIVNPARLPVKLRNDICYECHMQPTVILPALRKFDRDVYSFRPGRRLDDYEVRVDIDEAEVPRAERFEINHHPYRLEQSRCFKESEGRLSCLTCHDPHRKVTDVAHYRNACLSCHGQAHRQSEDCTSCHMPKRRTQDVVHVVMTDHFIRRMPGGAELTAGREEREPNVDRVDTSDELYSTVALLRATGGASAGAVQKLEELLTARKPVEIEPYLDLASAQLRQRRWTALEKTTSMILARDAKQELALEWRAVARAGMTGDTENAIATLKTLPRAEAAFKCRRVARGTGTISRGQRAVRTSARIASELCGGVEAPRGCAACTRRREGCG